MNIYKVVHTGPKIQLGGLKLGLLSVEYQVGIDDTVKIEPIAPAERQIPTERINLGKFMFFMFFTLYLQYETLRRDCQ